jgi:hypothetical protein
MKEFKVGERILIKIYGGEWVEGRFIGLYLDGARPYLFPYEIEIKSDHKLKVTTLCGPDEIVPISENASDNQIEAMKGLLYER